MSQPVQRAEQNQSGGTTVSFVAPLIRSADIAAAQSPYRKPVFTLKLGEGRGVGVELCRTISSEPSFSRSIPSTMLEQEAQILGFLDKLLPEALIGSPQQMQMVGFTVLRTTAAKEVLQRAGTVHEPASFHAFRPL